MSRDYMLARDCDVMLRNYKCFYLYPIFKLIIIWSLVGILFSVKTNNVNSAENITQILVHFEPKITGKLTFFKFATKLYSATLKHYR